MKLSSKKGINFGLASGVITTLGLIIGLNSSTSSRIAVIGGILVIAIADAMSDALGIHMSEEANEKNTDRQVWESTLTTFATKFIIALTFLIPIFLFELSIAVVISIIWGLTLIISASFLMAVKQKKNTIKVVFEHLTITILVIIIAQLVGSWVSTIR